MVRNIKERVRNYLNKQCEANLPATYQGFVYENPETDITSLQFSDAAIHLKSEFEKDPLKAKWFNSVRKGRNGLMSDEIAKYFPQRIHINTGKYDVRTYLNEQCDKKLPATYLDFKAKNPDTKIKKTQDYLTYVTQLKKGFLGTPEREQWYNEIRVSRERIPPEQLPLYYTRKYIARSIPQVRQYLLEQCAHQLPATYRGFKSDRPKTGITRSQYDKAIKFLRSEFEKDPEKAEWFNTVRTSPDGLAFDEIAKYFPKMIHVDTSRHEVRKYLNVQCTEKLPATYLDFKTKNPKTKIKNASIFSSYVAQVKEEFMETPERKQWFNEIRANKEILNPKQAPLYYSTSRKFVAGSNTDQIRQYLLKQCACGLPGTYAGFLAQSPGSTITLRQFNDSVKYLKGEFANDPAQKNWMENLRLKKTGLTPQQKLFYFPPKIMPGQTELVRQFLKDQRSNNGEVTYETFCAKYLKSTLAQDEYFNIIYSKLKPEYMQDSDSTNWFEDKFPPRLTRRPDEGKLVIEFHNSNYKNNTPSNWNQFKALYPAIEYDTYINYSKKWKELNKADSKAMKWYKSIRTQEANNAAQIGILFDKSIVAGIYPALRDMGIPVYNETTSFVQTGHHPKQGQLRNDCRVELRIFTSDLLNLGKNLGPALQKFLRNSKRPELVIDVSLSGFYGKKIAKYIDPSTCLLIIVPDGINGQQPLESNVRVLSFSEFFGPRWLNLDPATNQKLLCDLNLALKAIRSGPASQAGHDLRASMETQWNQLKPEIKSNASQEQYEARVLKEISNALRHGNLPKELKGYVQYAREAGYEEYADKLDLMTRAMAAIGKKLREGINEKIIETDLKPTKNMSNAGTEEILRKDETVKMKQSEPVVDETGGAKLDETTDMKKNVFHTSVRAVAAAAIRVQEACKEYSKVSVNPSEHSSDSRIECLQDKIIEQPKEELSLSEGQKEDIQEQVREIKQIQKEIMTAEKQAWRKLSRTQREQLRIDDRGDLAERAQSTEIISKTSHLERGEVADPDHRALQTIAKLKRDRADMAAAEKDAKAELAQEKERERQVEHTPPQAELAQGWQEWMQAKRALEQVERARELLKQVKRDSNREVSNDKDKSSEYRYREEPHGRSFRG